MPAGWWRTIMPSRYPRLLDRLFASRAIVDPEDAGFFGAAPNMAAAS